MRLTQRKTLIVIFVLTEFLTGKNLLHLLFIIG
jgi:hypothetical protein